MSATPSPSAVERHRAAVLATATGDLAVLRARRDDTAARVRAAAIGGLDAHGVLDDADLRRALDDPDPIVRRRAIDLAIGRVDLPLDERLDDTDPTVVEHAAWACGERALADTPDHVIERLVALAQHHDDALVREAAVAALGSLGDERGLVAILAGCRDKATVRRRAVLALAPFDGADVRAALAAARDDRDWQVRQSAEDLAAIIGLDDEA